MRIKTALITAAGFGTRFLPITKTIQKEMLPVLSRPIIDYVVDDLIKAGVEKIIFVINEHNIQLLHYYRENIRLYDYLKKMNKVEQYEWVKDLHSKAEFVFVKQPDSEQYGTAVPLKLAKAQLKDESQFFVFMGDDFIYQTNHQSAAAQMVKEYEQSGADGLVTCIEKPDEILHKYGIASIKSENGFRYLDKLVEKPRPGTAPSNLANISKYILTPEVFEILSVQKPNPNSGELYITDTVEALAQNHQVVVHQPSGTYLDGGYIAGWLKANITVAWQDGNLRKEIEHVVAKLKKLSVS